MAIGICTVTIHQNLNYCLVLLADIHGFMRACILLQPHQSERSHSLSRNASFTEFDSGQSVSGTSAVCVCSSESGPSSTSRNSSIGPGGIPSTTSRMAVWSLLSAWVNHPIYPNLVRRPVSLCMDRMLVPCSSDGQ